MDYHQQVNEMLKHHARIFASSTRSQLISAALENGEAMPSKNGALATWTPVESTGRSPKDTYLVRDQAVSMAIDWDSPNNIAMDQETFSMIFADALAQAGAAENLYISERVVGADSNYALKVRTVTDQALTVLFTENMFRPIPADFSRSVLADRDLLLIVLPRLKLDKAKYSGRLRKLLDGSASDLAVAVDMEKRIGLVIGSAYLGSVKKLVFTVMNFLLPGKGILPLHTSANEGRDGDIALFLGLSGTGKTTLSADPHRALLGDDEHGWDENGIANFEYGCYAKLINLDPLKEPQIYQAIMHRDDILAHGAIVENALMYPDGSFDFNDSRLTENSRGSYPLSFLPAVKESSCGGHPSNIIFLTADANGVLPPVALLNENQAMLWFLMGYTSKLAGTETGIKEPVTTFSRFFGQPFMPLNPEVYANMLGEKLKRHSTRVFLVNTGWSGGPYGQGRRMDISATRAVIDAILNGSFQSVQTREDRLFHFSVPLSCPGVEDKLLNPRSTWADGKEFDQRAEKLAREFSRHFEQAYGNKNIPARIAAECPGR